MVVCSVGEDIGVAGEAASFARASPEQASEGKGGGTVASQHI